VQLERSLDVLTKMGAGWVLWLLVILSVLGVAIIVERALYLWFSRDDLTKLGSELRTLLAQDEPTRARCRLEESPSFEARIARAALEGDSAGSAEELMLAESQLVRLNMERRLAFLGTLGNNAPFIGLLGTVIGIVRAFQTLDAGTGAPSAGLMAELGHALIATAVGLIVALPAVAAFNAFQRIIRARIGRGEVLAREVLAHFKRA
jgi:biopolymer transport protein ExbB